MPKSRIKPAKNEGKSWKGTFYPMNILFPMLFTSFVRPVWAVVLGCLFFGVAFGQQANFVYSVGIMAGIAQYSGDLSESPLQLPNLRPALGISAQARLTTWLGLRASGSWLTLTASDAHASDAIRQSRNLSFRSRIWEGSVQALLFAPLGRQVITPYLCGGVAVFRFNPRAYYQNQWVALQPLSTEGQGLTPFNMRRYRLSSWALPVGAGLACNLTKNLTLYAEAVYRRTFTDYIDDVSTTYFDPETLLQQRGATAAALANRSAEVIGENNLFPPGSVRGNPKYKDAYFLLTFTALWQLNSPASGGSKFERCYAF
ncbi:MAG TPA: DUF6089 family protein [Chitinophagales bacterium]|nr:DUF6089 family protein [Chitinophagales bacterium]